MARIVEQLTPLMISINARYKTHAGIRITRAARRRSLGMSVALLAGGTGGGKIAAGLQTLLGEELAVIANTGDDTELHGLYVSVDPDLVTFWLADVIDEERGWGYRDDEFTVHEHLQTLGAPGWFGLTDRDLATSLYRTHFLSEGGTLSAAQAQIARALGVRASVLPMSDDPVRTLVETANGTRALQEFLILDRGEGEISGVRLEGVENARPTPQALDALDGAELIVIAPSNPVISIGPILALPGIREAIERSGGPGRRGQPACGRALGQGPDRGVPSRRRPAGERRRRRLALRRPPRRHGCRPGRSRARARRHPGALERRP